MNQETATTKHECPNCQHDLPGIPPQRYWTRVRCTSCLGLFWHRRKSEASVAGIEVTDEMIPKEWDGDLIGNQSSK